MSAHTSKRLPPAGRRAMAPECSGLPDLWDNCQGFVRENRRAFVRPEPNLFSRPRRVFSVGWPSSLVASPGAAKNAVRSPPSSSCMRDIQGRLLGCGGAVPGPGDAGGPVNGVAQRRRGEDTTIVVSRRTGESRLDSTKTVAY